MVFRFTYILRCRLWWQQEFGGGYCGVQQECPMVMVTSCDVTCGLTCLTRGRRSLTVCLPPWSVLCVILTALLGATRTCTPKVGLLTESALARRQRWCWTSDNNTARTCFSFFAAPIGVFAKDVLLHVRTHLQKRASSCTSYFVCRKD